MDRVSILEFRRDAAQIIRKVQQGKRMMLTYRGKPVLRLEPIVDQEIGVDDPFYALDQLASADGQPVTNKEIDQLVYES